MTEKEMEKLFKSKLDSREFAFNPANWEKMEAILEQKAAAGRWYLWRSTAAILLFGVVVASVIYYNPGTISQYDAISGPDFIPEGRVLPNLKPVSESAVGAVKPETVAFKDAKKLSQTAEGDWAMASQTKTHTNAIANQTIKENTSGNTSSIFGEAGSSTTGEVNPIVTATRANGTSVAQQEERNFEPISLSELSSKDYVLPEWAVVDFQLREVGFAGDEQNAPLAGKLNTANLFVNVGPVFTGSNASNTLGTGFLAGVGYRKLLNYGFGVETGLNYFVLNNMNIQNNSDSVFYRFGKERVETEELNSRLDYIEIPLNLTYKFAPKHHLGVGGYAAILLNVQRDITKTTYTPKSGTYVEDEYASGYLDEFNRFDFGLSAFYRYSLTSRLNVGLHFKQGLVDITHDVSEGYAQDHTNFNTRIVLEYRLF